MIYTDESLIWDWQVTCAPQMAAYAQSYKVRTLNIHLVDDTTARELHEIVTYPGPGLPQAASAKTACQNANGVLDCYVAPELGSQPGAHLDTAVAAALPNALREAMAEHTAANRAEKRARGWQWSDFRPLVTQRGEEWQSAGLVLTQH